MAEQELEAIDFDTEGKNKIKKEYNSVTYNLKEGTLMITLFDRKKRRTIWQGYASGMLGGDQAKNDRVLKSVITQILDEYKLLSISS